MLRGGRAHAETAVPFPKRHEGIIVSMPLSAPYPVQLDFHADDHVTRWRPLVQWLLAIPRLMIAYALRCLRQVLTLISFFAVLFTGQYPEGIRDFLVSSYRYALRVEACVGFLTDRYPAFSLAAEGSRPWRAA